MSTSETPFSTETGTGSAADNLSSSHAVAAVTSSDDSSANSVNAAPCSVGPKRDTQLLSQPLGLPQRHSLPQLLKTDNNRETCAKFALQCKSCTITRKHQNCANTVQHNIIIFWEWFYLATNTKFQQHHQTYVLAAITGADRSGEAVRAVR